MKKTGSALWGAIPTLLAAVLLIAYAPAASRGAVAGLAACGRVILPAIFPFLVLSVYAANSPAGAAAATLLSGVAKRCYCLPPQAAPALFMSWIGGYPAGAKVLSELEGQGTISRDAAACGATVCINSGPAFMAGVVGAGIFQSVWVGIFLFACQLAAGLLTARILAIAGGRKTAVRKIGLPKAMPPRSSAAALVHAVTSAATATVNICAFVILLSAAGEVLFACGVFPLLARGIGWLSGGWIAGDTADCLLTGMLEICAGSARAMSLAPTEAAKILPFLLSFGGCSVWCQVAACFGEGGLPWGRLILSRLLHGLLTAVLAAPWLSTCAAALAMSGGAVLAQTGGELIWGTFWMLVLCLMLVLRWEKGDPWKRME